MQVGGVPGDEISFSDRNVIGAEIRVAIDDVVAECQMFGGVFNVFVKVVSNGGIGNGVCVVDVE